MTAADLIRELAKLPPETPVVRRTGQLGVWFEEVRGLEEVMVYRAPGGDYGQFQQLVKRNDVRAVVIQ